MNDISSKNYLAEYDAAAEADKYPLVQKWMKKEPLPFFKQLRAERPILVTPECTLVALFVDIRDALQMPKIFTVDLYKPKMGVTDADEGYLMAHDEDALHYREKSLMQGMLNRDDIPRVRELIANSAAKILNDSNGEIEIVNKYCRTVPAIMVQEYFGLDGIEIGRLIEWSYWNQYDTFHNQPFDLNSEELNKKIVDSHAQASKELVTYMAKLMARKLVVVKAEQTKNLLLIGWYAAKKLAMRLLKAESEPATDDVVSRMIASSFAKEVDFGLLRIGINAGGLLIGSVETTSQAVAQTIRYFIDRPELLSQARQQAQESNTDRFDAMVWEALRFVPISPYMFRQLSQDYTLAKGTGHETTIKTGTNVLTLTQSAMFDDYAYKNPEQFDPDRNWYHNFNFGFASHECLGKYVGMAMIPEMVKQILLKDGLQAASAMDYKDGPFPEAYELKWQKKV
ncbi:MAG: cytochrome P450 [Thiotrichaceae bacterium]